jgi:hypothetical protein
MNFNYKMTKEDQEKILKEYWTPLQKQGWKFTSSLNGVCKYVYDQYGNRIIIAFSHDDRIRQLKQFVDQRNKK